VILFRWKKLGLLFKPQEVEDRDWLRDYAQAPATLVFDEFVRVYFSCRPPPDERGQYTSYSAYIDLDRKNLFQIRQVAKSPILELGELGTFDEFGVYPVSVIRNGDAVMAYYGGWTRCESIPFTVSIGAAISTNDGESFTRIGKGPVLTCNVNDPFVISGPKIRKFNDLWCLWYVAVTEWLWNDGKPEAVYKVRMATSTDGISWTRDSRNIIENRLEENECQASPDVFFHNNKYHMFFCYKYSLNFRNNDRGYRIGYAVSDDMRHWTRDDSKAGIDLSPEGWDAESISYPHVFALDDQIYMLYLGNQFGKFGFGLAQLEGNLA
jgi:predicted GH43/DUF377 family glycosyl hydrolase